VGCAGVFLLNLAIACLMFWQKLMLKKKSAFDSILLNKNQHICETGSANIFWVKDEQIFTPHHDCGLVLGLIRQIICQNYKVHFVAEDWQSLYIADEVFITNSIILLKSVDTIEFDNKITKNYQKNAVSQKIASFLQEQLLLL
jgi:branched-subunit amino acid aminotransferase/4-amino-4-deoxychorismate lyase